MTWSKPDIRLQDTTPSAWSLERRGYNIGKALGFLYKRRNFYQPITLTAE
jgi:hypothetical protein